MANSILKGIAIAAGTGLAMGVSTGRPRSYERPRNNEIDDVLYIEPLLDRLEEVESRLEHLRHRQPEQHALSDRQAAMLSDLDRRMDEYARDLAQLREQAAKAERRTAESIATFERQVREAREEIPAIVERSVNARLEEVRVRFDAEMERSQQRTLEMFERAIDEKISNRIGAIEKKLEDQAGAIEALQARAVETDQNLQKLVSAIERLCERAQLIAPAPPQYPPSAWSGPAQPSVPSPAGAYDPRLPFETQLHEALQNQALQNQTLHNQALRNPAVRNAAAAPRAAEISEPGERPIDAAPVRAEAPAFASEKPKRSIFRFRNVIAFAVGLAGSRLFLR